MTESASETAASRRAFNRPPFRPWVVGLLAAVALCAYALAFVELFPLLGPAAAAPSMLLVALGAWFWGVRGGVLATLLTTVVSSNLFLWAGEPPRDLLLRSIPVTAVTLAIGWGVGRLRDARIQLARERDFALQVMNAVGQGLTVTDADGRFEFVNPAYARMVGLPVDELIGRRPEDFTQTANRGVIEQARAPQFGEASSYEVALQRADGSLVDVLVTGSPRWRDGQVVGAIAGITDLADRRRLGEAMHRREQEFRALAENAPDVIARFDRNLRHVYINPAIERALGLPRETVIGRTIAEAGGPAEHVAVWTSTLREVFESGQERILELATRTPGSTVYLQSRIVPELAPDGSVQSVLAISRDVSDRRRAEDALRDGEERYRKLVEQAGDIIYRTDIRGFFTYANPVAVRLTGFSKSEILTKHYLDLIRPDAREAARAFYLAQLHGVVPSTYYEFPMVTREGREVWIGQNLQLIWEEGRIVGIQAVARDMTELRRVREELQAAHNELEQRVAERTAELRAANESLQREIAERERAKAALREREEQYRTLFENALIGIYQTTPDGRVLVANPALLRMLGYTSLDEIAHLDLNEAGFENADTRHRFRELVEREGEVRDLESAWRRPDHSVLWVRESARAIRGEDGVVLYYEGTVEDITEQRRVEEALRQSERDYRGLFENAHDAIVLLDPDGEVILEANPRACELYGYTRAELLGRSVEEFSRDVEKGRVRIQETLHHGASFQFETAQFHRDGSERFLDINASVVDYRGRPAILSINRDITARKRVEQALRDSEMRFRMVVESLGEGLVITDTQDVVQYTNARMADITGYTREELVGHRAHEILVSAEEWSAFHNRMEERLRGISERYEMPLRRKDGTRAWVEVVATPFRNAAGEIIGTLGANTDITERRALEEQLRQAQKMEAVGKLAGGVAHDFNNLLTAVTGFSDLLLEELPPYDPRHAYVAEIKKAGQRAAALTRQLLAFSRKQVLQPRVLDLNAVVAEMDKMLRRLIGEDVELLTQLDPALGSVYADPGQLEQVLLNLAVNARDAMPTGGRLTIETRDVELDAQYAGAHAAVPSGPYVLLSVSDTGQGMDRDTQARIFEPFFTTKEVGKGTGLGLATVYGIIKQSGGHVWVYSEVGQGSVFKIYLPRHSAGVALVPPSARSGGSVRGTGTVLLVEDEAVVRGLTRTVLSRGGYTVLEAPGGAEALRLANEHAGRIDLLLTDVVMPGMSGPELARRMAALRPGLRVLFTSGYTDDAIVHHGVLEPGVDFLEKPFVPELLLARVHQAIAAPARDRHGSPAVA